MIVKNFGSSPAIDIRLGGAVVVRPKGWIWPLDENDWVNEKPSKAVPAFVESKGIPRRLGL